MANTRTNDFSEIACPYCRQRVPVGQHGKIVQHYETIKAAFGRKSSQRVCKGAGLDAKVYAGGAK